MHITITILHKEPALKSRNDYLNYCGAKFKQQHDDIQVLLLVTIKINDRSIHMQTKREKGKETEIDKKNKAGAHQYPSTQEA
jgi:hypothetical protein